MREGNKKGAFIVRLMSVKRRKKENLNPFHQDDYREEEPMPHRFGIVYRRKNADLGVKIDLAKFERRMNLDEFSGRLQTIERGGLW